MPAVRRSTAQPRSTILALLCLALLWVAFPRLAASAPAPPGADELAAHAAALAGPDMEGRGSGTPGGDRAARYVADRLAAAGLTPGGDNGTFFQAFSVGSFEAVGPGTALESVATTRTGPSAATSAPLEVGRQFMPHGGSRTGRAEGELVFVGHGTAPENGPDEYAGADVRGKIALALDGAGPNGGATRLDKLIAARRHGAAALLIVADALPSLESTAASVGILSATVTRAGADALLATAGRTMSALSSAGPGAVATAARARLQVEIVRQERRAQNVVGVLRGTDPALAGEAVVLGAHYDHLGRVGGAVHPGADDNASGTAVVLGLARAFAASGGAPRTLVFTLFAGEEIGLLGSAHYTRYPAVPIERTVAMLNFDMVGRMRDGRLNVGGVESGTGLRAAVEEAARGDGLDLSVKDSPFAPSDHASFYAAGVPVLFFHTGMHDDYHRPSDTAEKLNASGMAHAARVGAQVAERVAAGPRTTLVKVSRPPAGSRGGGEAGGPFLGVAMDARWESDGIRVGSVVPDSGAARAGLQGGDVLVRLDGAPLGSFEELRRALREKRPGDRVTLLYLRDGEDRTASAILGTRP